MTEHSLAATLQERYVFEVLHAARQLEAEGDRLFRTHRLTGPQFNVLNLLRRYQPMPQSVLNRAMVVGKATVSSVVAGLIKRRLVIQRPDLIDRRAKVLSLSATGAKLWKKASDDYLQSLKERLPKVDEDLITLTRRALKACDFSA